MGCPGYNYSCNSYQPACASQSHAPSASYSHSVSDSYVHNLSYNGSNGSSVGYQGQLDYSSSALQLDYKVSNAVKQNVQQEKEAEVLHDNLPVPVVPQNQLEVIKPKNTPKLTLEEQEIMQALQDNVEDPNIKQIEMIHIEEEMLLIRKRKIRRTVIRKH